MPVSNSVTSYFLAVIVYTSYSCAARHRFAGSTIDVLSSHSIVQALELGSLGTQQSWLDAHDASAWAGLTAFFVRHNRMNNDTSPPAGQRRHSKPRICIVMVDSRPIDLEYTHTRAVSVLPYYEAAVYINLLYAQRWKYDFLHLEVPEGNLSRHPSWLSLAAVKALTLQKDYNYLMFLDSDAYFVDQAVNIQSIAEEFHLHDKKSAWFPSDHPFSQDDLCAGVFLMKTDQHATDLLDYWWMQPSRDVALEWSLTQHAWEQSVLNTGDESVRMVFKDRIAVGEGAKYSHPEAPIIQHVYSCEPNFPWQPVAEHKRSAMVSKAMHKIFADKLAYESIRSLLTQQWNVLL